MSAGLTPSVLRLASRAAARSQEAAVASSSSSSSSSLLKAQKCHKPQQSSGGSRRRSFSTSSRSLQASPAPASFSAGILPRPPAPPTRPRIPRTVTSLIKGKGKKKAKQPFVAPVSTKPLTGSIQPLSQALAGTPVPANVAELVQRYPKHPLLQFFPLLSAEVTQREVEKSGKEKEVKKKVLLPTPLSEGDLGKDANGRSWLAPELRTKSSHELHQLWYVLLMERNRLATSWEEAKRLGVRQLITMNQGNLKYRNHRVRKSMARIKLVLNERRLALIEAQELARQPLRQGHQVRDPDTELWEDVPQEQDEVATGGGQTSSVKAQQS